MLRSTLLHTNRSASRSSCQDGKRRYKMKTFIRLFFLKLFLPPYPLSISLSPSLPSMSTAPSFPTTSQQSQEPKLFIILTMSLSQSYIHSSSCKFSFILTHFPFPYFPSLYSVPLQYSLTHQVQESNNFHTQLSLTQFSHTQLSQQLLVQESTNFHTQLSVTHNSLRQPMQEFTVNLWHMLVKIIQ